jgi:hypothetical protein
VDVGIMSKIRAKTRKPSEAKAENLKAQDGKDEA